MQNEVVDDDLNNRVDWSKAISEQIIEYSDYLVNQLAGVSLPIEALRCTARSCNIHNSPGILGFEMEKNNIKLKISESVHYVLLYYL